MQYQLVGTDPSGKLIYEPVAVSGEQQQDSSVKPVCKCQGAPKKKAGDSPYFEQWFIDEDGAISVSLRNLTIVSGLAITVALLAILYFSCNDGTGRYECTYERFPMISDVINQEMYNRIFILLTAIFMFGVQQVNIRAYFKKLYGIIPNS
jgi:hypothetical protein